jgi:serralysin
MTYKKYDGTDALVTIRANPEDEDVYSNTYGANLAAGPGNDLYTKDAPAITITEYEGEGIDTVKAYSGGVSLRYYPNVENIQFYNGEANTFYAAGNAGDNVIEVTGRVEVYGGRGQDVLVGGSGAQTFIVYRYEANPAASDNDVIYNFTPGEDVLRLKAGFTSVSGLSQWMTDTAAGDVDINLDRVAGGVNHLLIKGVTKAALLAHPESFQLELDPSLLGAKVFEDEFNSLSIYDKEDNPNGTWKPDTAYQPVDQVGDYGVGHPDELQIYTSPYFRNHGPSTTGDYFAQSPFSVADGVLTIHGAHATDTSELFGYNYTSGLITTNPEVEASNGSPSFRANGHSFLYGYFEIRAQTPQATGPEDIQTGSWPAFWMTPTPPAAWPPELDIMEQFGNGQMASTTKWWGEPDAAQSLGTAHLVPDSEGFHTYGALWTPDLIVWYIDGVEVWRTDTPTEMQNQEMYLMANLALGDQGGPLPAGWNGADYKIDYIRAYALGDGGPTDPPPQGGDTVRGQDENQANLLAGSAGSDTIYAGHNADTITGGGGDDRIVFQYEPWNAGRITDFGNGADAIDLTPLFAQAGVTWTSGDAVAQGYVTLEASGADTLVYFDRDAAGSAYPWPITITRVVGASPSQVQSHLILPSGSGGGSSGGSGGGSTGGQVIQGSDETQANVLTGTAGNDTIMAGWNADTLTGLGGADHFVFRFEPWNAGHVTDFTPGVDVLDLSELFDTYAAGYGGSNPVADGYLIFTNTASGVKVEFDDDGPGGAHPWPITITTLDGVTVSQLVAGRDWIF